MDYSDDDLILRINWAGINCKLDNQLSCWLPHQNFPKIVDDKIRKIEEQYRDNEPRKKEERTKVLEETVDVGEHITARVILIDHQKMSIRLSVKESDMSDSSMKPSKNISLGGDFDYFSFRRRVQIFGF